MKGNYITKAGEVKNIVDFDEVNKIACVRLSNGNNQWVHEPEYSIWVKEIEDTGSEEIADVITEDAPEVFEEETTDGIQHNPITEEPKKKAVKKVTTTKKKTK